MVRRGLRRVEVLERACHLVQAVTDVDGRAVLVVLVVDAVRNPLRNGADLSDELGDVDVGHDLSRVGGGPCRPIRAGARPARTAQAVLERATLAVDRLSCVGGSQVVRQRRTRQTGAYRRSAWSAGSPYQPCAIRASA